MLGALLLPKVMWSHASWESFLLVFLWKDGFLQALDCHHLIPATCMVLMEASQTENGFWHGKACNPLIVTPWHVWSYAADPCALSLHETKFLRSLPLSLVNPVNCWYQKKIPVVCNKHNVYTYVVVRDTLMKTCLGNHCWIRQICAYADNCSAESLMPFVSYFLRVWDLLLKEKKSGIIVITNSLGNI